MIKTRIGWLRSGSIARLKQKMQLGQRKVVFSCICNQCSCGNMGTVLWLKIPHCAGCGRPKQNIKKIYYGTSHGWFCRHYNQVVVGCQTEYKQETG